MTTTHQKVADTLSRMSSHAALKSTDPKHQSRKDVFKDLSTQLGEARSGWDKLEEPATHAGEKDQTDYGKYAKALEKGLPELENGIIDSVKAFESGDRLAEAESILNICSTLVSTLGELSGPEGAAVAGVLGPLLGMVTTILDLFEPEKEKPSLLAQIETLLQQEKAKDEIGKLKVALEDFEALEEVWRAGFWKPVNLQDGPEVQRMRDACEWLKRKDNQKEELKTLWFQVLETQCMTFLEVVKAVPLALGALNKQSVAPNEKKNSAGLLTVGLKHTQRKELEFLKEVAPMLQAHGIFWYLGMNGSMQSTDYCTDTDPAGEGYRGFRGLGGGGQTRMSIAISQADKGRSNPNLHLFSVGSSGLSHATMNWPSGELDWKALPIEEPAGCSDVWAVDGVNGTDSNETMFFYTAHGDKELRGYVLGVNNDQQESKISWREPVDKVTSVRVVNFPKPVAGDPDENKENPRVLSGISSIVYGGCKGTSKIWVWASNGKRGFVLAQDGQRYGYDTYDGIAVDQQYLWITFPAENGNLEGVCVASHTSVLRALSNGTQPSRPSWFTGPDSTELSPCDDGTLLRTVRNGVTFKRYSIVQDDDGDKTLIPNDNWTYLRDEAKQVQKLPHYLWPLVGGLIRALENKAKAAAKP